MALANQYSRIIRRHLEQHAAWLPITNVFQVGDFGVVSNGVFTRIGNIRDFGLHWVEKQGPASKINFTSSSVVATRFEAGVKVDVFSNNVDVDAALVFDFTKKSSFVLKADQITSTELDNALQVALALKDLDAWRWRYRFVTRAYTAHNALILASRQSSTKVTLTGKVGFLKKVELGEVDLNVGVSVNGDLALDIVGQTGVIGLGLARIRASGGPAPVDLRSTLPSEIRLEEDSDWDDEAEDDI